MSDLTSRLRGLYKVGENGEYGTRSFSDFIPPISIEAAKRIDELENALNLISGAKEVSENPLYLIQNICNEVIDS